MSGRKKAVPNEGRSEQSKISDGCGLQTTMINASIRTGICVLAAFAVLAHGAVEPWSEAVLEMGAAVLLLVWSSQTLMVGEMKLVWNPLLWPLIGFWLVAVLQLAIG